MTKEEAKKFLKEFYLQIEASVECGQWGGEYEEYYQNAIWNFEQEKFDVYIEAAILATRQNDLEDNNFIEALEAYKPEAFL